MLGYGWAVVLDDRNSSSSKKTTRSLMNVRKKNVKLGPHFHHKGVKVCALPRRECTDPRSWYKRPVLREEGGYVPKAAD